VGQSAERRAQSAERRAQALPQGSAAAGSSSSATAAASSSLGSETPGMQSGDRAKTDRRAAARYGSRQDHGSNQYEPGH
jgi:hypothetical protein